MLEPATITNAFVISREALSSTIKESIIVKNNPKLENFELLYNLSCKQLTAANLIALKEITIRPNIDGK